MNDNDDIHTYINIYSLAFSSSSSSSSSRLFIDSVLVVLHRDNSCLLDNRYPGHNSHLLLLYKKEKEKHNMYCCVKICSTNTNTLYGLLKQNTVLTVDTCGHVHDRRHAVDPNPFGSHNPTFVRKMNPVVRFGTFR